MLVTNQLNMKHLSTQGENTVGEVGEIIGPRSGVEVAAFGGQMFPVS